jgi:hypothetical protein
LAGSSSPNKSSSSAFDSGFFSYFFSSFFSSFLFYFFGLALKALCAYFGKSFDPMVASVAIIAKYQATIFGYVFLSYSPKRVVRTTLRAGANARSAIES